MNNCQRIIVPPIKCQGIKTKLVPWIKEVLPKNNSGRWIEPFAGSGVVAFNMGFRNVLFADSNPHLIHFYQAIQDGYMNAESARKFLTEEGRHLELSNGEYYYVVRERFNQAKDPYDFLFLNRACFNGMIRFNKKGGFNVPFCRKPNRFAPAYITKICNQIDAVSHIIGRNFYEFRCQGFEDTIKIARKEDVIYCDPPYIGRHVDYFNNWDSANEQALKRALDNTPAKFVLSTWHSNDYRYNQYLESLWSEYKYVTKEHFYHVGAKIENRNHILEALIINFEI